MRRYVIIRRNNKIRFISMIENFLQLYINRNDTLLRQEFKIIFPKRSEFIDKTILVEVSSDNNALSDA